MHRRTFFAGLGALGAASLLPATARAAGVAQNLIVIHAGGGWDTTYLFDPKPDSALVDTGAGDWVAFGNGALWFDSSRQAVTDFFDAYGHLAAVINGVNVPSVAHGSCTHRILTGSRDSRKPDIGAIVGHVQGQSTPMPYLDIGGAARPGILGADMGYLGTNNQLGGLVLESESPRPLDRPNWHRYFPEEAEFDRLQAYVEQRAARMGDRAARGLNAQRHGAFLSGLERSHRLRDYPDFFGSLGNGRAFIDQARIGIDALQAGVSRTLFLSIAADFDTHANNITQTDSYNQAFADVHALLDSLATTPGAVEATMLDETVILLVSEMGRTPQLNAQDGKDHWPITSSVVLGAGIRGGQIYGGTTDALGARPIDLDSGAALDSGGTIVQPEHIHAGLLELFGIDPEAWFPGVQPLRALHG